MVLGGVPCVGRWEEKLSGEKKRKDKALGSNSTSATKSVSLATRVISSELVHLSLARRWRAHGPGARGGARTQ